MVSLRQKDHVLRLLAGGVALAEIAKRTRVPRRMVHRIAKAAGLLPPPQPPKSRPPKKPQPPKTEGRRHGVAPWQYAVALAALRAGATCADAADHAGIADRTAARLARTYGLRVRPRGRPKGESGVPMLLREAALRMVREGATLAEAGAQVGVSRQRVFQWAQDAGVKVGKGKKRKAQARAPGRRGATLAKMAEMA